MLGRIQDHLEGSSISINEYEKTDLLHFKTCLEDRHCVKCSYPRYTYNQRDPGRLWEALAVYELDCGEGVLQCLRMPTIIKLYTLNMCNSLYINYTLVNYLKKNRLIYFLNI